MDKIYEASICRYWTTERMEIHELSSISVLGSMCGGIFQTLSWGVVVRQQSFHWAEENRDQNLGLLNKKKFVRQKKSHSDFPESLAEPYLQNETVRTSREQLSYGENISGKDQSFNQPYREISLNIKSFN